MSLSGTWDLELTTPMGPQKMLAELSEDGATLTGSLSNPMLGSAPISDGTISGAQVAWKVALTQPLALTLVFTGVLEGETISGDAEFGPMGKGTFTAVRG